MPRTYKRVFRWFTERNLKPYGPEFENLAQAKNWGYYNKSLANVKLFERTGKMEWTEVV